MAQTGVRLVKIDFLWPDLPGFTRIRFGLIRHLGSFGFVLRTGLDGQNPL
jgi:hypothetical protein